MLTWMLSDRVFTVTKTTATRPIVHGPRKHDILVLEQTINVNTRFFDGSVLFVSGNNQPLFGFTPIRLECCRRGETYPEMLSITTETMSAAMVL